MLTFISCNGQQSIQPKNINDKTQTTIYDDGDMVTSSLQDKAGNIWFGTTREGVYRYDGKSFTNFTEKNGLCNNDVWSMIEDKDGVLYFGTDNGLCYYDGQNFTHVSLPTPEHKSLWGDICNGSQVIALMEDSKGYLWLGTCGNGAFRYDRSADQTGDDAFVHFLANEGKLQSDGIHHNVVKSIVEDDDGNIWFTSLTHGGVSRYDPSAQEVEGEKFTHFTSKDGLLDDMVFASHKDKKGNLWFGCIQTIDGGLYRYDASMEMSGEKPFINYSKADGLCDNFVTSFYEDRAGRLWIGTGSGLCIYEPSTAGDDGKSMTAFTTKDGEIKGEVRTILEDNAGNMWFGGRKGKLWKYDGKLLTDFTLKGRGE